MDSFIFDRDNLPATTVGDYNEEYTIEELLKEINDDIRRLEEWKKQMVNELNNFIFDNFDELISHFKPNLIELIQNEIKQFPHVIQMLIVCLKNPSTGSNSMA